MKNLESNDVAKLTTSALERMAFLMCDGWGGDAPTDLYYSRIGFSGPDEESVVQLGASEGCLRELGAALLGMEPFEVDVDDDGISALKELANVLCGEVLVALGSEEEHFDVEIPAQLDEPELTAGDAPLVCRLEVEGEYLELSIARRAKTD